MRKSKRFLVLFLSIIMLLGTFTSVFANEVNVNLDEGEIVQKLIEEGYVVGYPDGSLGLNKNISRAEFAAITVRVLGLEDLVDSMQNVETKYKDVKKSDWYNPYVAIATNKGIIVGYPDGSFKPEKNITYAEAITMMVRMAINNQAELEKIEKNGKYPTNYLLKASQMGLLKGVNPEDVNQTAIRGKVFTIMYNAINLIQKENTIQLDVLVLEKNKDNLVVTVLRDADKFKEKDTLTVKVKDNDFKANVGQIYTIRIDKENNLISLEESENAKTITGEISKDRDKFKIDRKIYDTDNLIKLLYNNDEKSFKTFPIKVDFAKATLYYGKLVYVDGYNFELVVPVEGVKNGKIYSITDTGAIKVLNNTKNTKILLSKDGDFTEIKIDEIKEGDIAHVQKQGKDTIILITNKKEKGKLEDYNIKENTIKIGNHEYYVEMGRNKAILAQGRRCIALSSLNNLEKLIGNEVEVSFNLNGEVQFIKIDQDTAIYTKAIIEHKDRDRLFVLTEDGYREYFYITEMTELVSSRRNSRRNYIDDYRDRYRIDRIMSQLNEGDVIKVLVDGRGDVEELKVLDGREGVITYIDGYVVEVNGRDEYLSDDFVVFTNIDSNYKVINFDKLDDFLYKNIGAKIEGTIYEDNRLVEVIVVEKLNEGVKKELLKLIEEAENGIKIASKYKENKEISKAINSIQKTIDEVKVNLDKLTEKNIEKYSKTLRKDIDNLYKQVLDEILSQLSVKLENVKSNKLCYNKETFEIINNFVKETEVLKIENYLEKIKEAENYLENFDKLINEGITELQKEISILENAVKTELLEVTKVINRAVHNEELAKNYKAFLDGLKNEIPNIKDMETLNIWKEDFIKRRENFRKNKFNLEGKTKVEVKIFELEEKIDVGSKLLEQTKGKKWAEIKNLQTAIKNAESFANNYKRNKKPEKVKEEKLIEVTKDLTKAIVDVVAKLDIDKEGLFKNPKLEQLRNKVVFAETIKEKLINEGRTDEALVLNELLLETIGNVYVGKTDDMSIERMIKDIDNLLEKIAEKVEKSEEQSVKELPEETEKEKDKPIKLMPEEQSEEDSEKITDKMFIIKDNK